MAALGFPEIEVRHVQAFLAEDAGRLVRHVCDYMLDSGKRIKPGETMATSPRTTLQFVIAKPMLGHEDHYDVERLLIVETEPVCECCGGKPARTI
jgi:hypothetical protein